MKQGIRLTVLLREFNGHSKHPLPTAQETIVYTWTSPDGQYQNQIDYILCSPMDCSTPGFPVHHQIPESTQTYVH